MFSFKTDGSAFRVLHNFSYDIDGNFPNDGVILSGDTLYWTACELVLAGGAESMSQAEFYATGIRWGIKGGSVELADRLRARASPPAGTATPSRGG